jgi:hypothetical protein
MASPADDALLARYLIGQCSDEEQERVESEFLESDDTFDRMCAIEEDLVARYQRGELTPDERASFERSVGSGARRDRVLLNLALASVARETHQRGEPRAWTAPAAAAVRTAADVPWWRRWARLEPVGARLVLVGASLVLAVGVFTLVSRERNQQLALDRARQEAEAIRQQAAASGQRAAEWEQRAAALADQLRQRQTTAVEERPPRPPDRVVAAFVLLPGLTRGTRPPPRVLISGAVDLVQLQLNLESDVSYRQYRVEIRTAGGETLWSEDGLQRRGSSLAPTVVVALPAALLVNGEHELLLSGRLASGGLEEIASYYFTVARK